MLFSIDDAVDKIHHGVNCLQLLIPYYRTITLLQFPHASLFSLGANALNGATSVYASNAGKPRLYWLHSLVMVVLGAFGGGTVAPLLIGKPSMIVANDQIIVLCIIAWYSTHYLGLQSFFTYKPIKILWTFFLGLFRTHSVINVVVAATGVLAPTIYYPIPLVGPIVVGTALGCLGMFLPFDKGFTPIKNNTPWNLQGALMTAAFYHLMVHDKTGFIGVTLRAVVGTYDAGTVKTIIATMQIVSLELQVLFNGDANIFTPVHKLLYLVFQVQGPLLSLPVVEKPNAGWDIRTRDSLAKLLESLRVMAVVVALVSYVFLLVPAHSLHALSADRLLLTQSTDTQSNQLGLMELLPLSAVHKPPVDLVFPVATFTLVGSFLGTVTSSLHSDQLSVFKLGDTRGSCQYMSAARGCKPYLMRLEEVYTALDGSAPTCAANGSSAICPPTGYRLAVYDGSVITALSAPHYAVDMPLVRDLREKVDATGDDLQQRVAELAGGGLVAAAANPPSVVGEVALYLSTEGQLFLTQKAVSTAGSVFQFSVLWSSDHASCGENLTQNTNTTIVRNEVTKLSVDPTTGRPALVCASGKLSFL